jgi:hypothetical protein
MKHQLAWSTINRRENSETLKKEAGHSQENQVEREIASRPGYETDKIEN